MQEWDEVEVRESIRNKFVTGNWGKEGDTKELEEEEYGDFQDLETGEEFKGNTNAEVKDPEDSEDPKDPEDFQVLISKGKKGGGENFN